MGQTPEPLMLRACITFLLRHVLFPQDIWIGKQILKERHRIRRIAPGVVKAVMVAGKQLMKSLIKNTAPRITKNGAKLTKQYFKKGGYRSAKKDFLRFKPSHVQSLGKVRVHVIPNERDIP